MHYLIANQRKQEPQIGQSGYWWTPYTLVGVHFPVCILFCINTPRIVQFAVCKV